MWSLFFPMFLCGKSIAQYFLNNLQSLITFYKQTPTFAVLSQNSGNGRYYIVENNIIGLVKNKQ
jgi:hypothetical protein